MYLVRSIVNMSVVLALVGRNFDDKKFLVDKVALEEFYHLICRLSPISIIPPITCHHRYMSYHLTPPLCLCYDIIPVHYLLK